MPSLIVENLTTMLQKYVIQLADNALILGQRLGEWCGHGPILEQDIAISNIALDQIGQARSLFQYASKLDALGRDEDQIALLRPENEYLNCLLVELPNVDWAYTVVRQFLYDSYAKPFYQALTESTDATLAAIAHKSIKEVTYHQRFSSEWVIRLGDGTELSHQKMQGALDFLWPYRNELVINTALEADLIEAGIAVDLDKIRPQFDEHIHTVLETATLKVPSNSWNHAGGKSGKHTEAFAYLLLELQYMQKAYPNLTW